ncbi:unnamed protein product [Effrenium voratum]|nr:unnamed protein product [Effrenium voratum]
MRRCRACVFFCGMAFQVAERFPMLLLGCRNVEQQLAPLVSFLRSLGVDPKCAACRGFYAWPEAHKVLEPTVASARYLLDECGYGPKELAENVDVLGYSLEARIYPRGRFLQHLKTRLPLRVHAAADDFQFCQLLGVRREQFLEFALDLRREMRTNAALQSRGARGGQEPKPRVAAVARFERRPGQKPSEPLESSSFALSFGLPLRMYSPHRKGCVAASCALEKKTVYMRSIRDESIKSKEFCAKDVWVIEPANHEFLKDTGIEYSVTPVLLRHLGSGYYLAISESDLADKSVSYNKDDLPGGKAPRKDPASWLAYLNALVDVVLGIRLWHHTDCFFPTMWRN